ncbi:hypothetical protein GC163_01815 [bacterium]|nr:hypothetical protein [bacterium]
MKIPSVSRRRAVFDQSVMTPLIDVVFQLLIFFMCASVGHIREWLMPFDFGAGTGIQSAMPVEKPLGDVWIRLSRRNDQTLVNIAGTDYPEWAAVAAVLQALGETAAEIPVILDIAPNVPMQDVIRVDDLCRRAKFESVSFAAGESPQSATDPAGQ